MLSDVYICWGSFGEYCVCQALSFHSSVSSVQCRYKRSALTLSGLLMPTYLVFVLIQGVAVDSIECQLWCKVLQRVFVLARVQ